MQRSAHPLHPRPAENVYGTSSRHWSQPGSNRATVVTLAGLPAVHPPPPRHLPPPSRQGRRGSAVEASSPLLCCYWHCPPRPAACTSTSPCCSGCKPSAFLPPAPWVSCTCRVCLGSWRSSHNLLWGLPYPALPPSRCIWRLHWRSSYAAPLASAKRGREQERRGVQALVLAEALVLVTAPLMMMMMVPSMAPDGAFLGPLRIALIMASPTWATSTSLAQEAAWSFRLWGPLDASHGSQTGAWKLAAGGAVAGRLAASRTAEARITIVTVALGAAHSAAN